MDIKEAAPIPAAAQSGAAPSGADIATTARRGILAAAAAGVAVSLVPWLNSRASAASTTPESTTPGSTETTVEATTTTAPPKQPTADDIALLDLLQSAELAARDLYDVAMDAQVFDGSVAADVAAIREAHEGYATSISGLIGRGAANVRNDTLFDALEADFGGDADAVSAAAALLENNLVATHVEALGQIVGVDGAALIASILVIEARNATLLTSLSGVDALADLLTSNGEALSPSDSPVE